MIILSALYILATTVMIGQPSPTPCADRSSSRQVTAAALRPADVLLAITSPRAGEMIPEATPSHSVTVTVDYWGPHLVPAAAAHTIDQYHLVFFLDSNDAPYVGSLSPVPHCSTSIVHSSGASVTFENVIRGSHTVSVMLAGSNDISVNPPVVASISFVVTDSGV
jgi:hypothetical protein